MSDLQDLIATNAVRAYNEGFERGVASERERILKWVEATTDWDDFGEFIVYKDELIALIKGEQK